MNEIWLPIVGYCDYEISNRGNVRSIDRSIIYSNDKTYTYKSQLIKPNISKFG